MTYIIAEPCVDLKDAACVDVCPVDCIYVADEDSPNHYDPEVENAPAMTGEMGGWTAPKDVILRLGRRTVRLDRSHSVATGLSGQRTNVRRTPSPAWPPHPFVKFATEPPSVRTTIPQRTASPRWRKPSAMRRYAGSRPCVPISKTALP